MKIDGKTVVITGAARGIGFATARALLRRGARVVIGDRDVALTEAAVAELNRFGDVTGRPLDVTDPGAFAAFIDKARTDSSTGIDVLINNAGVMPVGPFLDHSDAAVRSAVEVNLYGVLTGCRLVLPEMVRRRHGQIVNIASVAGVVAVPGQALYAATKFAIVGLTTALSDEFAPQGVDISCVLPTFTNTELISGTAATGATKPVQPEDIAAAIVRTIEKPKTTVTVPYPLRFVAAMTATLSPRARRWLGRKARTDRVFLDYDTTARAAYEQRAQSATGLVNSGQEPNPRGGSSQ